MAHWEGGLGVSKKELRVQRVRGPWWESAGMGMKGMKFAAGESIEGSWKAEVIKGCGLGKRYIDVGGWTGLTSALKPEGFFSAGLFLRALFLA